MSQVIVHWWPEVVATRVGGGGPLDCCDGRWLWLQLGGRGPACSRRAWGLVYSGEGASLRCSEVCGPFVLCASVGAFVLGTSALCPPAALRLCSVSTRCL